MSRTYVIADIGSNHGGSLQQALLAITQVAEVGADCAKLQWVSDGHRMAKRRGQGAEYGETCQEYSGWPADWHGALATLCRECGIEYMCSVFLPEDVEVVAPYVARFKVASFEAMDEEMLEAHDGYDQSVLISTGMLNEWEVDDLRTRCLQRDKAVRYGLLLCVSAYPAPPESLNFTLLRGAQYVGFSDHSDPFHTSTGALAVTAGAGVIEAHFRSGDAFEAYKLPDFSHSMDPDHFRAYVEQIRFAEKVLGDGGPREQQECEEEMDGYRVINY